MTKQPNLPARIDDDVARLMGDVMPGAEDEREVQRAIVARILAAGTLEETFQDLTTIATRELKGVPIAIRGCRLMRSDIEGSTGVYMLLDCVYLATGEQFVANTGAAQIMATVWAANHHGFLPVEVEVAEAKPPKTGRDAPLKLVPIGKTLEAITKNRPTAAAAPA